jgi:hypothetical protein
MVFELGGGECRGVASFVMIPSSSPSSTDVMPIVLRLVLATPRLNALDVGPWNRGCLLNDLVRDRADEEGSIDC